MRKSNWVAWLTCLRGWVSDRVFWLAVVVICSIAATARYEVSINLVDGFRFQPARPAELHFACEVGRAPLARVPKDLSAATTRQDGPSQRIGHDTRPSEHDAPCP